jgi:putative alpha-1,2-mannosidase
MGFYPVTPSVPHYVLGSPLFRKITLNLENGKTFTIQAPNNSPENVYVQSVTLNGRPLANTWISHEDIMRGGTLSFQMSSRPNLERGTAVSARPYSMNTWESVTEK